MMLPGVLTGCRYLETLFEGVGVEHEPWIRDTIELWVADYLDDAALRSIDGALRPQAEELLVTFLFQACAVQGLPPGEIGRREVKEALLEGMQSFSVAEKVRPKVPRTIGDFLSDLEHRGRLADGAMLGKYVAAMREAYLEATAEKPAPVVRPAEKIGRNDPCPCGSGQKYKKCCMRTFGS